MARPLFLHIGLPKSGTTYLQSVLAANRDRLREAGYIYPFVRPEGMFHAAVELRGQAALWGLDEHVVEGTWAQLLDRARGFDGPAIVSHEILAGASPEVIARIGSDTADRELHVVVTARDLARQAAAHWQEEVKNGRSWSFAAFEDALFTEQESTAAELGFWRSQDLLDVVRRWSAVVPADRLHLVVVPRHGAASDELWRRFALTVGLPASAVDLAVVTASNDSLGVAQVALLRRVVAALDGRLGQPAYAHVVKRWFAQQVLSRLESPRPEAPAELAERLAAIARGWAAFLEDAGHPVTGEAAELVPSGARPGAHPDSVTPEDVGRQVPVALAELLVETARLRRTREVGP
jgi:hypothetical protein